RWHGGDERRGPARRGRAFRPDGGRDGLRLAQRAGVPLWRAGETRAAAERHGAEGEDIHRGLHTAVPRGDNSGTLAKVMQGNGRTAGEAVEGLPETGAGGT